MKLPKTHQQDGGLPLPTSDLFGKSFSIRRDVLNLTMAQWKIADSLDLSSITPRDWIQAIGARGGFLTALLTDQEREFVRIVYLPNADGDGRREPAPPRRSIHQLVRLLNFMTTHLIDPKGNLIVKIGDEVENDDARFFVGGINESQQLCTLDKSKPWTLKNEASAMAKCIRKGNYAASAVTLNNLSNA